MLVLHSDTSRVWASDRKPPIGRPDKGTDEATPVTEGCKEGNDKFTGRVHKVTVEAKGGDVGAFWRRGGMTSSIRSSEIALIFRSGLYEREPAWTTTKSDRLSINFQGNDLLGQAGRTSTRGPIDKDPGRGNSATVRAKS